ncbi:MAG: hypothetical protein WBM64_05670, partial [Woeseiaceae bacterium]
AELRPDGLLRRFVVLSAVGLSVLGIAVIFTLPFPVSGLLMASVGWLVLCAWELVVACRRLWGCRCLRLFAGGEILLLDAGGTWHPARLSSGSVVLRRIGWILVETRQGSRFAGLVRGRCRESDDWRRLQVIWRHIGGTP